jgi:branched-chain amino acid transport system permease protein
MGISFQLCLNGILAGSGYGLIAVSFAVIYRTTHFFHFAHGAVYAVGAYAGFVFLSLIDAPAPFAVLAGATAAAMTGGIIEMGIYRPLRNRHAGSIILLLASLGLLVAIQNLLSLAFGDGIRSMVDADVREGINLLGPKITPTQIVILLVSSGLFFLTATYLRHSRVGKVLRAVGSDGELSQILGIDSGRTILLAFLIGSFLAGAGAVVVAFDTGLRPAMGFNALLYGVVGMVVGGIGSISGAFLGGVALGLAQQMAVLVLPSKWQDAIVFVILILFLLFRPQGFLGKPLRKAAV